MTRRPPTPRPKVYNLYWYYASERQAMFARRIAGSAPPWTTDPILQTFKFCNVFRAADRVSQYMIREVCYHDEDRSPTLDDLGDGAFTNALDHARAANGGLYTGAFILCATDAYGQGLKHLNHVELFRHMFLTHDLGKRLLDAASLREVYELLHGYPLMGDFMSYQTTIDLNYSALINFPENEFTVPGPGALRGIKKCFTDLGDYKPADVIAWMVDNQETALNRLGLPFGGLFGRALQAIDCQGLFCETDKYCREAAPELASARKRIKARFSVTPEPIRLFFPPKWDINRNAPSELVFTQSGPLGARRPRQATLFEP